MGIFLGCLGFISRSLLPSLLPYALILRALGWFSVLWMLGVPSSATKIWFARCTSLKVLPMRMEIPHRVSLQGEENNKFF